MAYSFKGNGDGLLIASGVAAGAVAVACGIVYLCVFNPFFVMTAGVAYVLATAVPECVRSLSTLFFPKKKKEEAVDTILLAEKERALQLVLELARRAELPYQPSLIVEKEGVHNFAAQIATGSVVISEEALAYHRDEDVLRFVLAHETAHLKQDSVAIGASSVMMLELAKLAAVGVMAGTISLIAGFPLVFLGMGSGLGLASLTAGLIAVGHVMECGFMFASRVKEYRADRNALYLTRDLKGAFAMMDMLHDQEDRKPCSIWEEMRRSHPGYTRRKAALEKAFKEVSKYPLPAAQNVAQEKALRLG